MWSQELESVILVGPFQLIIFCDSMKIKYFYRLNTDMSTDITTTTFKHNFFALIS